MGMFKDVNGLIKEITSVINALQSGYRKYGVGNKLSRAKNGFKTKNEKATSKVYGFTSKTIDWIKQEMKK